MPKIQGPSGIVFVVIAASTPLELRKRRLDIYDNFVYNDK